MQQGNVTEQKSKATVNVFETYWHTVVAFKGNFADYQIAMAFPFFHIGKVRAAIEAQVQGPVIIMNWHKLSVEEYVASRESLTPKEAAAAAAPGVEATPVAAVANGADATKKVAKPTKKDKKPKKH